MRLGLYLCLLLACPLGATITQLTVSGATSTRAIVSYTAPDSSACLIEVSENSGYAPPVYDVDPTKFTGANLDNRADNANSGRKRNFVVGKRAAETALDNKRYSRALQTNTVHYFRLTCPSTGDVATGQFQTQNILLGQTYADALPVDKNNPGDYAWPSLSYSDRTEKFVDPLTGALIRRLTLPQDRYLDLGTARIPVPLTNTRTSGWLNPANALNASGSYATVSGNNTATLYLSAKDSRLWSNGAGGFIIQPSYVSNNYSLNYFQLTITAMTSGCASMEDCKILACLTIDGAHCYPGAKLIEQTLTSSATAYTFGSKTVDLWQSPGTRPPNGPELASRAGLAVCDGSSNVTRAGGDPFNILWGAGSTLTVNNIDYTIASVVGLNNIALSGTCPTTNGANATYVGSNFGVLIRKKTASADTVSVRNAQVSYQLGVNPFFSSSGAFDLCGPTPVVGPTGNQGYNCALPQNGPLYWIDATTGESHLFGRNLNYGCGSFDSVIFDTADPDTYYCGGASPYRVKYVGNHSEPSNTDVPGQFEEGENLPVCNGTARSATNQPCIIPTNLTGTSTLPALITQFDPNFQADRFLSVNLVGVENGHVIYRLWRGNANSVGWTVAFDPYTTSNGQPGNAGCMGGGNPGCVIAAQSSWQSPGARWCTLKSNSPMNTPGWLEIGPDFNGGDGETAPGRGPWNSTVTGAANTAFVSALDAPGGPTACPANPFTGDGDRCTTVTVDDEPRDLSPCTASDAACGGAVETGLPGEYGIAAVGDYFTLGTVNGELARLVAKGGNSWTFQRGLGGSAIPDTTADNPLVYAVCNSEPNPNAFAASEYFWNYTADPHGTNTTGNTVVGDPYSIQAHYYWQNGTNATSYTLDPRCNDTVGADCYQTRVGAIPGVLNVPPSAVVQLNPFFGGKHGFAGTDQVQTHPTGPGARSPAADQAYFLDGRPFNGGPISGSTNGLKIGDSPATLISGQLWKFTAAQIPFLDRKFMATFASAGPKTLQDVSGPLSTLGAASKDSYKYCVAAQAGECVAGSAAGDVYINAPFVHLAYCNSPGQATPGSDDIDLCIGNNAMVYDSIVEAGVTTVDTTGATQRVLSNGFGRLRMLPVFWHPNALPNARWMLVISPYAADGFRTEVFVVKVPPPPAPDNLNRNTFIPVLVTVPPPPPAMRFNNVIAEFGYSENGGASNFYCTSRAEACAVGLANAENTVDPVNPFYFETSEAALTGKECSHGCDIAVPAISQRVLYGRIVYRDSNNAVLARSGMFAVAVP
ncbi:MAG: hypothetical protein M3Y07_00290 [Acidobacteriota bacterium]|nr:hypothetical protein [Acidobacteriota bacterium]